MFRQNGLLLVDEYLSILSVLLNMDNRPINLSNVVNVEDGLLSLSRMLCAILSGGFRDL